MSKYFDYNATAPVRPEVVEAMRSALEEPLGNPSSMHAWGRRAHAVIDEARHSVAALLGCRAKQVLFTSGATESNNLAIGGYCARRLIAGIPARIITTEVEHISILAAADAARIRGAETQRLKVGPDGSLDFNQLHRLAGSGSGLMSIASANGESGHCPALGRIKQALSKYVLLHVDAAQAVGRIPTRFDENIIDVMSLSTHKCGGPCGVGALLLGERAEAEILPIMYGGPQEEGLRPGTQNLAGIAGMGEAARCIAVELRNEERRLRALREELWNRLQEALSGVFRISPSDGLPNILTVSVPQLKSETLIAGLDLAGFAVSSGSACAAASPEPSHVIQGLAVPPRYRNGVVRISMGHDTKSADVEELAEAFVKVVGRAREAA